MSFSDWLLRRKANKVTGHASGGRKKNLSPFSFKPGLESLDGRILPSASFFGGGGFGGGERENGRQRDEAGHNKAGETDDHGRTVAGSVLGCDVEIASALMLGPR